MKIAQQIEQRVIKKRFEKGIEKKQFEVAEKLLSESLWLNEFENKN